MKKIINFFKESFQELKKVVWPSRDSVVSSTKVVIVTIVLVALVLFFVDMGLTRLVGDVLPKLVSGGK